MSINRAVLYLLTTTLWLSLGQPLSASAADIAFFPPETSNLNPSDNLAIGELLAQSYAGESRAAVLSPARTHDAVAKSTSYEAAANSLGVKEYVRISTLAVGRLTVITATRYRSDATFVYQSKMTAQSMEDVPAISDRMAKALYHRVDNEEVRTRDNVVQSETRVKPRRASEKIIGFKTGVYFPFANEASYTTHIGAQFDMRFEMDRFFLEFAAGLVLPGSSYSCDNYDATYNCQSKKGNITSITGEIGGSYFLTDGNAAPYIGVGLIPRLLIADYSDDIASMSGYVQVGFMVPRDSSTRFYADVRAAQAMTESHLRNGRSVHPTELTLHIGVGW